MQKAARASRSSISNTPPHPSHSSVPKVPSGVSGFDDISFGGLPKGRPTLVYGGPGCGKTLFGIQFLACGATLAGDAGVFLSFQESIDDLRQNVKSLGYHLGELQRRNLLTIEHAAIDPAREIGRGEYDLDALFMRLARAIDSTKSTRVVIDALETIIQSDADEKHVRRSFERLFQWLKNRGVTSIITAEEGPDRRSRFQFEEYIADCVVRLDHRLYEQVSTRTLRIVKYRGSRHGTNEYPFLIDERGIHVLPVTSAALDHDASSERVSTGVARLDTMLHGGGLYTGSTVLISGTPGAGKTSLMAHYMDAAGARGERTLAFVYEESPAQIVRNMRSIGIDLQRWVDKDLLRFMAARPSMYGLEMHLAVMLKAVHDYSPQSVIVDPISNLVRAGGSDRDAHSMVVRLIDALKTRGITALLTHPTTERRHVIDTDLQVSSIIDTWIAVQAVESNGERNRTLFVLKSRGMAHSNQVREFVITGNGVKLVDVYTGPEGVLTGSARAAREASERNAALQRQQRVAREHRRVERKRRAIEAQIAALKAELADDSAEAGEMAATAEAAEAQRISDRADMARRRGADRAAHAQPVRKRR